MSNDYASDVDRRRAAEASPTAVAPLQDLLGLSAEARMNTPGRPEGNWRWRFTWEQLSGPIQTRMCELTAATGRTHPPRARRSHP